MSLDYEYNLNFLFLEKFDSLLNIKRTLLILIMKKNIELIEYKQMEIFFSPSFLNLIIFNIIYILINLQIYIKMRNFNLFFKKMIKFFKFL